LRQRTFPDEAPTSNLEPLRVTVLQEPISTVGGLVSATPIGLILLLYTFNAIYTGSDLEGFIVLASIGIVMLLVYSLAARLIGGKRLTIDSTELVLVMRSRRISMTWDRPIQVRRWRTNVIGIGSMITKSNYEVLELMQADTKLMLWRASNYSQVKHLPRKSATGFRVAGMRNGRLAFEQIIHWGDLRWVQPT
jgi:hypothetical protein